jgi:hypothetical protein
MTAAHLMVVDGRRPVNNYVCLSRPVHRLLVLLSPFYDSHRDTFFIHTISKSECLLFFILQIDPYVVFFV